MSKILLCVTLVCVLGYSYIPKLNINKELKPYYNWYKVLAEKNCAPEKYNHPRVFDIVFADLNYPTIGICSFNYFGSFKIQIDRSYWKYASPEKKLSLLAHENTHCWFSVEHVSDPHNYMAPVISFLSEEELTKQVNTFMKEKCK